MRLPVTAPARPQELASLRLSRRLYRAVLGHAAGGQVLLTREAGKNAELLRRLSREGIDAVEVPMLETADGPDRQALPEALTNKQLAWVTITSGEAATVFLQAWTAAGHPKLRVAAVGKATAAVLEAHSPPCPVAFVPSRADGAHLAAELPADEGQPDALVLYPASAQASIGLQADLHFRGFQVKRLNTYDTRPVSSLDSAAMEVTKAAAVVAIASPSALKAWLGFVGAQHAAAKSVACIGATSAKAAAKAGLTRIFQPEKPGLDGLATSIKEALAAA